MKCNYDDMKYAGLIHKKIKTYVKDLIKPNIKLYDLAINIEEKINELSLYNVENPLNGGIAFPTGLSVNNCAAHWTPYKNNEKLFKKDDVLKIDFGIHLNGSIIDSAFTYSFDSKYDNLLEASKTSTDLAIKLARPDMLLSEIGKEIEENINSYEIIIKGKTKKIVSVKNLCGHEINLFNIHGNKVIPNISFPMYNERIKEGEFYAVETFASSGTGETYEDIKNCSHYMIDYKNEKDKLNINNDLYKYIIKNYNTLPFTDRWLDNNYKDNLDKLCSMNVIQCYPPIYDYDKKAYISQFEESIYIGENKTEILSN